MAFEDLDFFGREDPADKNYWLITFPSLKTSTEYDFKFKWIFADSALNNKVGSNWSPIYRHLTKSIGLPTPVTNLSANFKLLDNSAIDPGKTFRVRFTHDNSFKDNVFDNTQISYYKITLQALENGTGTTTFDWYGFPKENPNKTWELGFATNQAKFRPGQTGIATKFKVTIFAVSKDGLTGTPVEVVSDAYTTPLPKPSYSVTAGAYSYIVTLSNFSSAGSALALSRVQEIITTDQVTVPSVSDPRWNTVKYIYTNPIYVDVTDLGFRWVRVVYVDNGGDLFDNSLISVYGDPVGVQPSDPVSDAVDTTPPPNASSVSTSWSGNDILITPTYAAGDDSSRIIITLTASSLSRSFTYFKNSSINGSFLITGDQLYNAFGDYYKSFSGVFYGIDLAGNQNTGTSFSVTTKTNPLTGITPTFTLTGITNGYTATWSLPTGATFAKVYEGTTSSFTPNDLTNLVYSGVSPAIVKKTVYTEVFVKIVYSNQYGDLSNYSNAVAVTPVNPISVDNNPPNPPSTGLSATSGIDTTGTLGFNGFISFSWTAVSDTTLRGYRIRFRPVTTPSSSYSYVDSPGTATTYRLSGLAVGATYEVAIASYDEFNNTSSTYTSFSNQTITGSPAISNYITAGNFQFGSGIKDSTGAQNALIQGIYLSNSNYWYIDSASSARLNIGGSTSNYLNWNGSVFAIDGTIVARNGSFSGNIELKTSGASIWNGALNSGGTLSGDGFVLNNSGLAIRKGTNQVSLDTATGGIIANNGLIAGWTIDATKFEKLVSTNYTGISTGGTYAFYAGSPTSGGSSTAEFYVTPSGAVKANNIVVTGGQLQIGSTFTVTNAGALTATGATIGGNLNVTGTGAVTGNFGVTSGTLYVGAALSTDNDRIVINSAGIAAYPSGSVLANFELTRAGSLIAKLGTIAGWSITADTINKSGVVLDSTNNAIYVNNISGYHAGISRPSSTTDIAIFAGASLANKTLAPFKVDATGKLYASGAVISGTMTIDGSSTLGGTSVGTVVSGSTAGASALQPNGTLTGSVSGTALIDGVAASTVKTQAANGNTALSQVSTKLNSSATGIVQSNNNITAINASGITVFSNGTSSSTEPGTGARVVMNSAGIAGFNSSGIATFSVEASSGNAIFKGDITGASGTFGGVTLNSSGITANQFSINSSGSAFFSGKINGGDIDISTDTSTDRIKTSYMRGGPVDPFQVSSLAINAIAHVSTTTSGWVTSTYPYWDGGSDLGVSSYRWRRLLINNGSYGTSADSYIDLGVNTTRLYADGRIFANTLGVGTGTTLVQSSGFIRVSSSSLRYKENIVELSQSGSIDIIKKLKPVVFNYKQEFAPTDYNILVSGLIAEDVDKIEELKTIVNYNEDGLPESISYDRLSAHLVLAIKEISEKINLINSRLDDLEG